MEAGPKTRLVESLADVLEETGVLTTATKGCFYTVKPSEAYPLRINFIN